MGLALGLSQHLLVLVAVVEVQGKLDLLAGHRVVALRVQPVLLQLVVLGVLDKYFLVLTMLVEVVVAQL